MLTIEDQNTHSSRLNNAVSRCADIAVGMTGAYPFPLSPSSRDTLLFVENEQYPALGAALIAELRTHLLTVHQGQRVRLNTLLRRRIESARVGALLRDREELIHHLNREPALAELVCTGALEAGADTGAATLILRRRFSREERQRAVVDLNNLIWTLSPAVIVRVLEELRRCGVHSIHGVGDANLPFLADPEVMELLREALDTLTISPGGTPADLIILEDAERNGSIIVSSDMFRDWRRSSPWRRRNIHRLRVPVVSRAGLEDEFSFGEAGVELRAAPPAPPAPSPLPPAP